MSNWRLGVLFHWIESTRKPGRVEYDMALLLVSFWDLRL